MSNGKFIVYRQFTDEQLVKVMAEILSQNNIENEIANEKPVLDERFTPIAFDFNIYLKLKPEDFSKADSVLETYYSNRLDDVEEHYYLFTFSNNELLEILSKPDEWGQFDYSLAQKILKDRGVSINERDLKEFKELRKMELAKPEKSISLMIVAGYLFSLLGAIIGLFIGFIILTNKKILPDGSKVYSYSEKDRLHGLIITLVSIILFLFVFFQEISDAIRINS